MRGTLALAGIVAGALALASIFAAAVWLVHVMTGALAFFLAILAQGAAL